MRDHTNAVFYDASGKRRVQFWYFVAAVAVFFLVAVVIFAFCLNAAPQFTPLLLSQADPLAAVTTKPGVIPDDEDSPEENVPYSVNGDEEYAGGGRIPAYEIMVTNHAVRNVIRDNKIYEIPNIINTNLEEGMVPLDKTLALLVKQGLVEFEVAQNYVLDNDFFLSLVS